MASLPYIKHRSMGESSLAKLQIDRPFKRAKPQELGKGV
jgi:hypothetical protein